MIIGCKWAGQPQKHTPDDYCHRCPFATHSNECSHYRKDHQAIFVEENEGNKNGDQSVKGGKK